MSSVTSTSSASRYMTQSPVAASKETLRASAKDPVHGNSMTLAPNDSAISTVLSVEPVSTMIISSTAPATAARQRGSICSSSRTIMQRLRVRPAAGGAEQRLRGVEAPQLIQGHAGEVEDGGLAGSVLQHVQRRGGDGHVHTSGHSLGCLRGGAHAGVDQRELGVEAAL